MESINSQSGKKRVTIGEEGRVSNSPLGKCSPFRRESRESISFPILPHLPKWGALPNGELDTLPFFLPNGEFPSSPMGSASPTGPTMGVTLHWGRRKRMLPPYFDPRPVFKKSLWKVMQYI